VFVSGQTALLSGKITDENNKPVELANVAILGEKGGTTTNRKGEYELQVPANKDLIIAITYVGFAEKKIPMNLIVPKAWCASTRVMHRWHHLSPKAFPISSKPCREFRPTTK